MPHERIEDIKAKIYYANSIHQDLLGIIFKPKISEEEIRTIPLKSADALQNIRDCLDYTARDIANDFIDARHIKEKKVYFPFYVSQLTKKNSIWSHLKSEEPHDILTLFSNLIENDNKIIELYSSFGVLSQMNTMVNEKKTRQNQRCPKIHE